MEKAHKKLKAWREAIELVKVIYEITSRLPPEEKYGLTSQMRRSAISIPSNIAEGAARQTKKESVQYYMIARGSLSELDTQVELCGQLNLLGSSHISHLSSHVNAVDALSQRTIPYNKTNRTQQRPP